MTAPYAEPIMSAISQRQFRALAWTQVYEYSGHTKSFKTFGCGLPYLTMTHEWQRGKKPMRIYYTVAGRSTDSPTQIVRWYNEEAKARLNGGRRDAPGSVEALRRNKR